MPEVELNKLREREKMSPKKGRGREKVGFCVKCGKTGEIGSLSCHYMEISVFKDSIEVFAQVHDEIIYTVEPV